MLRGARGWRASLSGKVGARPPKAVEKSRGNEEQPVPAGPQEPYHPAPTRFAEVQGPYTKAQREPPPADHGRGRRLDPFRSPPHGDDATDDLIHGRRGVRQRGAVST